jgi:DNA (cytosine-5)-methyltransferase 1
MITFGSCFAGIGGFDLGFARAGMVPLWNVEKDANCRKLLANQFSDTQQFSDVCTVGVANAPRVDVICGGFPCQDLSLAGERAGLIGGRSGLFYQLTRITHELQPSFLVWENVPGLFSSDEGRDFARVLMELDRIGYCGGWRVLNAQHFGVAQRRRRIFGVFARRDIGAGRCGEVLALTESLRWNHPESGGEGKAVAATLTRSALGGGSACGGDGKAEFLVSHTLTGEGADASEDGTGRGTPLVADTVTSKWAKGTGGPSGDDCQNLVAPTLTGGSRKNGGYSHEDASLVAQPIAFSSKDSGADAGELAPTLRAMGHKDSHANGGGQIAIAFSGRNRGAEPAANRAARPPHVMADATGALDTVKPWNVANESGVRRVTPRECERLQGFPDDWTAGFSDSTRYKMLGNAVAVPCAEWIGKRLVRVGVKP